MIAFDFDDVIADTSAAFIDIIRTQYNVTHFTKEKWTNFKVINCPEPVEKDIVIKAFDQLYVDPLELGLQPIPGALEGLATLAQSQPITIITARPTAEPVMAWLLHYEPSLVHNLSVHATSNHDGKVKPLIEAGIRLFVDDRMETCEMVTAQTAIKTFLFKQPWNATSAHPNKCADWKALLPTLQAELQNLHDASQLQAPKATQR